MSNTHNSINNLPDSSHNQTPPSVPSAFRRSSFFTALYNLFFSPASVSQSATPPSVHQNPPPSSERISEITSSWFQNGNNVVGNEIETSLRNWENENAPGEDRQIAAQRIRGFLNNTSQSSLDLSNLSLSTLPSIFNSDPFVTRLTMLDVSRNQLTALPEAIGELQALQTLFVVHNQLRALPEAIGELRALQWLDVSWNQLEALPEAIGRLQALQRLDVFNNQLRALPEAIGELRALQTLNVFRNQLRALPEAIGGLQALQRLDLFDNQLTALPEAIGELRALQRLDVGFNQLTALPEAIGRLQALQRLEVFNNQLRALPEAIGELRALQWLNVSYNQLTALPEVIGGLRELKILILRNNISLTGVPNEMLSLPSTCIIGLEQTGLSEAVRTRLRDICGSPNYHGPMISFSMVHAELPVSSERSAEELLSELCSLSGSAPKDFHNLFASDANKNNLRMWLARLSYAADYRKGGEFQKAFARKVLHYLHVAEENEQFRETFFDTIAGAAETCGDRVALSILHLGIACKLATIDTKDIKQLENFLIHTVLPIELLEKIARDKIPALHFYDEIEVYLGYPVMLRERLKMEIDVDEMLYFRCSALQQTDLDCAKEDVLRTQKDDEKSCLFLVKNDRWIDSLKANYPDEFAKIENEISNAEESCTSESDYVNLRNLREEKLIDLTAWARGQF